MIRPGYRARWHGAEYEASPDGDLMRIFAADRAAGFDEVRPGRYRRLVPVGEIEWFGYLHVTGRVNGEPVILLAERGTEVLVEYVGGREPVARALGFDPVEPGVYQGWRQRSLVTDVTELRSGPPIVTGRS